MSILPAETCPSREGKSSYKILKKKEVVTSTFLATGERGTGEGGGGWNKDRNSLTYLILIH